MKNLQTALITSSGWQRFFPLLFGFTMIAILSLVAGCNAADSSEEQTDSGEITIGLTDAEGDFVSYSVAVKSLTLTKKNGAVVETLPLQTEVDFAQYTEMTEFLTAATVPAGVYTHATLTLDYADADIQVEDANGDAVKVNQFLDEDGNEVTTLELTVRLTDRNQLTIVPGVPAHLTMDFDLAASNRVNMDDPAQPIITVQPFLVAELNPEAPKLHRLRGPLQKVNPAEGIFNVIIRPFLHSLAGRDTRFGTLKVISRDATIYEIDGQNYRGQQGLDQLAAMPVFTATVVKGDLKFNPRRFEAREVYAGSSVRGGEMDVVTGSIIKRENDTLTIKGGMLIRGAGSVVFNDEITILLGESTKVTRQMDAEEYDIDAISVGQRIAVFGTLDTDAAQGRVLDATAGHVRMVLTTLSGTVVEASESEQKMVLDLTSIGRHRVALFDFTGTGTDPGNDADPDNYEVSTTELDLSSYAAGAPVKIRGFVQTYGIAPPDFSASTLIDVSAARALLLVDWQPASLVPFEAISADGMTLSLVGAGDLHHLFRAGVPVDLQNAVSSPSLQPGRDGRGHYLIVDDGVFVVHSSFEQLTEDLQQRLGNSEAVRSVTAHGVYHDEQATLATGSVRVKMD